MYLQHGMVRMQDQDAKERVTSHQIVGATYSQQQPNIL